jgi:hypothetical protein
MASIEVDARGLSELAGYCEQQAARVAAIAPPSSSGGWFQPSVAAVEAAHADVAAASARLTARMQSAATAASAAASEYASTDASAADEIVAVTGSVDVTAV